MLKPRAVVQTSKAYRPPLGDRRGLHLDFNENTAGCSPRVLQALTKLSAQAIATYPEREPGEQLVATQLNRQPGEILLTNGVDEAIHLIAEAYLEPEDEVVIPVPTFSMYEIYARATSARIVRVDPEPDFQFPTEEILSALTPKTKFIVVANPNNPTGALAPREDLLRIAQAASQAALLVDEAYFDFCGETLLPYVAQYENLFVARTFSKAYGMAGLRLGCVVAQSQQTELLRRVASPYNVNAVALACLDSALHDQKYIDDYVRQIKAGRTGLQNLLTELQVKFWPSSANFVLARFGALRPIVLEQMRAHGILLRDRDTDPGCAGCIRITLGTNEQNLLLFESLRTIVQNARKEKL